MNSAFNRSPLEAVGRRLSKRWSELLAFPPLRAVTSHWRQTYGLLAIAIGSALIAAKFINLPGKAPDFTVFWAAATHAFGPVYDSNFITPLQNGPPGPRPFANPPTFLLMSLPIGLLPFKAAFVASVSASVAAYFAVGLRLTKLAWLAMFSPTLIFVALIGQTTLLAGSLAVLGLTLVRQKSLAAGVLLGLAACIKPQLVILAPLALFFMRDGRAIFAAGLTILTLASVTTLVFGIGVWAAWFQSLADFQAITNHLAIGRLSLPPRPLVLVCGGIVVISLMALAARRADRPRLIIATVGGSLLLSPYAAHYESVVPLLPALALLRLDWRLLPIGLLLVGAAITTYPFAAVMLLLSLPTKPIEGWAFLSEPREPSSAI
jgi:hypothetical protein